MGRGVRLTQTEKLHIQVTDYYSGKKDAYIVLLFGIL